MGPAVREAQGTERNDRDDGERPGPNEQRHRARRVVDFRPWPGQVDHHRHAVGHREEVDRQTPASHREQRPTAGVGGRCVPTHSPQPVGQQRCGHQQVGDVDRDDADAGERGEDRGVADVHQEHTDTRDTDHDRRRNGCPGCRVDAGQERRERQPLIARHREHQAGGRGLNCQGADEDRDGHVDEEQRPPRRRQHRAQHVGQALGREATVGQARRRHQCADDHQAAAERRHRQCRPDGARRHAARVPRLLRQLAGRTEADHHVGGHQPRGDPGPAVARTRCAGVEHDLRTTLGMGEEHSDDRDDSDDLAADTDRRDPRHPAHPDAVDRGGDQQQRRTQQHRIGRSVRRGEGGVGADDLESRPHRRQHHLQRDGRGGRRDDLGQNHEPATEPADDFAAEAAGPLVDGPRDRVAGGQFREAQGHGELPDEHRRPGPEERRTAETEAETE